MSQERYEFILDLAGHANPYAQVTLKTGDPRKLNIIWEWHDLEFEFFLYKDKISDNKYLYDTIFECARTMSKKENIPAVSDQKRMISQIRTALSVSDNYTPQLANAVSLALDALDGLCDELTGRAE